jgi:hypothetical protein
MVTDNFVYCVKSKLQALKFLSDSDSLYDTTPLVDMGVDSLVAVEVRSWFLKELAVDVPVMKILGGASVTDLVEVVVQKLPQELLTRFDPEGKHKSGSDNVPTPAADEKSEEPEERKTNGIDSAHEVNVNGVNGTHDTIDAANVTNGTVIITEKVETKSTDGVLPIIISGQEVAYDGRRGIPV